MLKCKLITKRIKMYWMNWGTDLKIIDLSRKFRNSYFIPVNFNILTSYTFYADGKTQTG